jgi:hypothetical protein
MKKQLSFMFTFLLAVSLATAQSPVLSFETTDHDFGTVREEGGPISHEFVFTNNGKAPVVISNVKASCGCTTPSWTKEPVAPGQKGTIVAQYNPKNRPGAFRKSITVTSNADPSTTVLYIKGNVNPKPKTPQGDFPTAMGNIRVKYRSFNMGKVLTKESVTRTFDVFNDSDKPLTFSTNVVTPGHISVDIEPQTLQPKQKGAIKVTYDPTEAVERNRLGFSTDRIRLFTDEENDSLKEFTVMATVEEYFEPLTEEQLEKAPKLTFAAKTHDFGTISQDQKVTTDFTFTNTGKSELNIRATKANCGCTVSNPDKDTLAPGESSKISVTFNPRGRRGKQSKVITVFSNDPSAPTQQVNITANVDAPASEQ